MNEFREAAVGIEIKWKKIKQLIRDRKQYKTLYAKKRKVERHTIKIVSM